jgi:hypothetical protein
MFTAPQSSSSFLIAAPWHAATRRQSTRDRIIGFTR